MLIPRFLSLQSGSVDSATRELLASWRAEDATIDRHNSVKPTRSGWPRGQLFR
jgi:hypothetical protein